MRRCWVVSTFNSSVGDLMLNRLALTNWRHSCSRYCGVETRFKRKSSSHPCIRRIIPRRLIINRREHFVNNPWQLLPREIRADLLGGAIPTDTPVSRRRMKPREFRGLKGLHEDCGGAATIGPEAVGPSRVAIPEYVRPAPMDGRMCSDRG